MTEQNIIDAFTKRSRNFGGDVVGRTQMAFDNGADWLSQTREPIDVVAKKTLKLNRISHNSVARLLRVQARFIERTVDATAKRLKVVAEADTPRTMLDKQIELTSATRDRIMTDLRKTLEILSDTRDDLRELVTETFSELREGAGDETEETIKRVRRAAPRKRTTAKAAG